MALTYPWFLIGLLSIAIPIGLHLFELRRPKKLLFTNVGFIKEVKLVTARQRKLKHLLVLLTRVGFLVFLVLIFAQPYIPALIQSSEMQDLVGVVVDASPSMQSGEADGQTKFETASIQARELPTAYSGSARYILSSEPTAGTNAAAYQAAVDKQTVSGQLVSVKTEVSRLNKGAAKPQQIFIFSDFQKNSFTKNSLETLRANQEVFLVPVGGKEARNVFVDSVWLEDAFVRVNTDVAVHIRLRNGGTEAVSNCQVKLFVGEKQAVAFGIAIPAGEAATTVARVRLENEQLQSCRIKLEDFPVTFDNKFFFTLQPAPKIKVLDVAAIATAPTRRLYANEPLFAYSFLGANISTYGGLESANLVVVQGQPKIAAGLRESLLRVVQRGGSVVVVPPTERADQASYAQLFQELGIGGISWEQATAQPVLQEVAQPDVRSPFFRDVFGVQSRQPVMPKVSPVLRWSRSDMDILRLRSGDGFLAGFRSGKGVVYLFSAPFDNAYSDFAQHALFVPVMYRLAMQSFRNDQQPAYRLNQGTLAVNIGEEAANAEQVYKLTKDSVSYIPAQRVQGGLLRFDLPPGMNDPGFYKLTRAGKELTTLAFNFDKRESELASYSANELRRLIGPDRPNIHVYDASGGESVAARYKAERVGTPLWQYCLWGALACLLAEVLLLRFVNKPKGAASVAMPA